LKEAREYTREITAWKMSNMDKVNSVKKMGHGHVGNTQLTQIQNTNNGDK
jgi:hypothetical protein